VKYTGIRI